MSFPELSRGGFQTRPDSDPFFMNSLEKDPALGYSRIARMKAFADA